MTGLALMIPSRQRPANIARILDDLQATDTQSTLVVGVDQDDPYLKQYLELSLHPYWRNSRLIIEPRTQFGFVDAANRTYAVIKDDFEHFAFIGDDTRIRTPWEEPTLDLLNRIGAGVVYWNDLWHGPNLCTHWAVTGNIPAALGSFVPPTFRHLFVDNFYMELAHTLGSLHYLPEVVIEHLHPLYGKAPMSKQYEDVNSVAMYQHDDHALRTFQASSTYLKLVAALKPLVNPLEGNESD